MGFCFSHPLGPAPPSTVGETEAEKGEGTHLSTHSRPRDLRMQDSRLRGHALSQCGKTSPAGKTPGPVGWGQHTPNPPLPPGCVSMCVLCVLSVSAMVLACHVSGVASYGMMCVSLCRCGPLCVYVSVQGQPLPERGEKRRSTPPPPPHPPESVSLILAASAAKNKFPQGRLGLRPGRPQITFEVT